MQLEILKPLFAMIALTFVVWSWMLIDRLRSMLKHGVGMEDLRTRAGEARIADSDNSSDNFENLLEIPILFYLLIVLLIVTSKSDPLYVTGAWLFFGSRVIHSLIHCTINNITCNSRSSP